MGFSIFLLLCTFVLHYTTISINGIHSDTTDDCPLDLQTLCSTQLSNIATMNQSAYNQSNEIFLEHYGMFVIEISQVSDGNIHFAVIDDILHVDYTMAEDFLIAFGRSVAQLTISFNSIPEQMHQAIGKLVNIYCAETLIEFEAKDSKEEIFGQMDKAFEKVNRAIFTNIQTKGTNATNISELFPKLRSLTLNDVSRDYFNQKYPNLVKFGAQSTIDSDFRPLIEANPQIQVLVFCKTSLHFLKMANEKLLALKVLSFIIPLDVKYSEGPEIHFENVKELLIVDIYDYFKPGKMFFKQLNRLEIEMYGQVTADWIEFVGLHKQLTSLSILFGLFDSWSLLELSKRVSGLIYMNIRCDTRTDLETIATFLRINIKMKEVILHSYPVGSELFFKQLSTKLEHEWTVSPMDVKYLRLNLIKLEMLPNATSLANDDIDDVENSTENQIYFGEESLIVNNVTNAECETF